ncbi:SLAM family member 9-like [Scomber japonicus]|uniref:SLAM family member 9-like n=1 Tax=Scomber japonicus TaxID=13676 RepID=UPI002306900D|nr:SLAM family member 9-like [Scomber japonicus]
MEKLTRCFMSVLLLSAVLSSGLTEEKFFGEGGTLELRPDFSSEINTVTWKLNNKLVAEWLKTINAVTYYHVFEGRTTLNKVTGTLNITNKSPADSGVYSVEINNMVLPERYNVKAIKEVPQPAVELNLLSCSDASDNCTLLCEGKSDEAVALAEAEPVTYSWRMGDREWMDAEKIRTITNDEETQRVETFSCRMKNPISEKQSDPIPNPFYREDPPEGLFYKKR